MPVFELKMESPISDNRGSLTHPVRPQRSPRIPEAGTFLGDLTAEVLENAEFPFSFL
jgi:hypothetical protein